ncbi:uncharacterized protein ACNS7B_002035 isoform 1-T1 [Menidia menidia]
MSVLSAAQRWTSQIPLSGVACWTCGGTRAGAGYEPPDRDPNRQTASSKRKPKPGRECPLTEVVQVIRVVGPPAPFPGPGGTYSVPVRIQGGTHRAMVDSGFTQSMVHQNLVRPGALLVGCVDIMCAHGDVHRYSVVPVEIRYKGKKHSIKGAVSPRLAHPLILGTDWPGFDKLVGQCVGIRSRPTGTWDICAVLSGDARSSNTANREGELAGPPPEAPLVPVVNFMACHMGYDKTLNRIMARFYWPGIRVDVRRWCAVCPECQLVNRPAIPRALLRPLPLMEVPFERVGMVLIGPFHRSTHGYRFVLVLVDYATRYPEAVPLRTICFKSSPESGSRKRS